MAVCRANISWQTPAKTLRHADLVKAQIPGRAGLSLPSMAAHPNGQRRSRFTSKRTPSARTSPTALLIATRGPSSKIGEPWECSILALVLPHCVRIWLKSSVCGGGLCRKLVPEAISGAAVQMLPLLKPRRNAWVGFLCVEPGTGKLHGRTRLSSPCSTRASGL